MKILWLVNIMFPYPSDKLGRDRTVFGGWLIGLFDELKNNKDLQFGIVSVYDGNELKKYDDGNTKYYLVPYKKMEKYSDNSSGYFKEVIDEFQPDIVHFHGSEYPYGLAFYNNTMGYKSVLSLQGLVSVCADYYFSGISKKDVITNITLRDILRFDNLFQTRRRLVKKGKYEKELLKKMDYIIGRTSWDRANSYNITNKDNYYLCNANLRNEFYNIDWNIDNIQRHSIFVSQASYPIKGFHQVIKACAILKRKYPDLVVNVAGSNIINRRYKTTGYGKYIKKMIKKYKLEGSINFVGAIDANEMCNHLLRSNVFVSASSVENESNSICEAMLIGMPIVSSYAGGVPDMLKDKDEGLMYPFLEYPMLAKYIDDIFSDDNLAITLGKNAQKHAKVTHNRKINAARMIEIYKKIVDVKDDKK